MEMMDIDEEAVVDLSISSRRVPEPRAILGPPTGSWPSRRSLRPRTEHRSYAESPDIVIVSDEEPKTNGFPNGTCETDDEELEMPPLPPIKELTKAELEEREKTVRRLKDELRNEEMKLVLLKKLRQSHQMKENIAVVAPCTSISTQVPAQGTKQAPPRASSKPPPQPNVHHLLRGLENGGRLPAPETLHKQPGLTSRGAPSVHVPPPLLQNRSLAPGMPSSMHQTSPSVNRVNNNVGGRNINIPFTTERKDSRHSPVPVTPQQERVRMEDSQTPAQRQAAAKLALRKQLEKTLLQIPPPKPPPPEMHFIPNPSNTEFIYLVGLEHVVDYITKDSRSPPPPEPFRCSQCSTNFTPVWKWEKGSSKGGKEPRVICEQCVTTNVKKALKAEHTNRLKTAFVKALQQEQEIEQRLAQGSPQPEGSSTPATPQAPPVGKPATPKPAPPIPSPNREHLAKLADTAKFNPHHAAAALHQQLLRGLPQHQPLPAHMLPFSPLLYPYQLAMAQAAGGKGPVAAAAANIVELQQLQRQYLLDMIPPPNASRHSMNNWKT